MVSIRRAVIADVEDVIRLRIALLKESRPEGPEDEKAFLEMTRSYIEDRLPKEEFLVWLAEEDGRIVGSSGLVFSHRPPTFGNMSTLHAYIHNMYVVPEKRRQGVASMLLQETIDYIKTTPAKRVLLHATDMGRPVYEKFGFKKSDNYMTLTLPTE